MKSATLDNKHRMLGMEGGKSSIFDELDINIVPTTTYDLNHAKLQEWHAKVLQCNNYPKGSQHAQIYEGLVNTIFQNLEYVSWQHFYRDLIECIERCLSALPRGHRIGLFTGSDRRKSNYWLSKHFLRYLKQNYPERFRQIDIIDKFNVNDNVDHVVFIDDASYSGWQMNNIVDGVSQSRFLSPEPVTCHVIVPYVSSIALKLLQSIESTVVYYKHTMKSLAQGMSEAGVEVWNGQSIATQKQINNTILANEIFGEHFAAPQTILPRQSMYFQSSLEIASSYNIVSTIPLYFQHKVADSISAPSTILASGKVSNFCSDKSPIVFIDNCVPLPEEEAEDGTKAGHKCAEPFYKKGNSNGGSRSGPRGPREQKELVPSGHHLLNYGILVKKKYVTYDSRRYRVLYAKHKPYIMVSNQPIYLASIKGRYRAATR